MKSMQQMQKEMLTKARLDGEFPKPVVMGMGILALAKDEKEYRKLIREGAIAHAFLGAGMVVILVSLIVAFLITNP